MNISGLSGMIGQMQSQMFKGADTDGNGGLSKAEFQKMTETMKANAPAGMQPPSGMGSVEDIFAKADVDGSGELSLNEMKTGMQANMPKMDSASFMSMLQFGQNEEDTSGLSSLFGGQEASSSSDMMSSLIQQLLANYKTDANQNLRDDLKKDNGQANTTNQVA